MWLALLAVVAGALYFALMAHGVDDALTFVKPLPALILAVELLRVHRPLARLMAAGLLFAAGGDAALQRSGDLPFIIGMLCFIVQHCVYISAFLQAGQAAGESLRPTPARVVCAALYAVGLAALLFLLPHAGVLIVPLLIYSAFLMTMAVCELFVVERPGGAAVATGAVLFVGSDVLLGLSRFYPGFVLQGETAQYAIIAAYYAAQIFLALGFCRVTATLPERAGAMATAP